MALDTPSTELTTSPDVQESHPTTKVEMWRERLARHEASEQSVAEFCRSVNCSVPSFYQWRRKLRLEQTSPGFLRVQSSVASADTNLEIRLPSGVSIFLPLHAICSLPKILEQVA
jgi:hypothetical protein